ncbi:MAG: hypothetical protein KAI47_01345 [Deltaproteobacteria bacterium]|nr:hypothetical protein [Deltaproteobacteria bacterium]
MRHWPLDDPAAAGGSGDAIRDAFRRVHDELRGRLVTFFKEPGKRGSGV